jgi:DNA-binding transcriptional regulator YdaS (Cro superfamily)
MIGIKDKGRVLSLLVECIERAVKHGITKQEIRQAVDKALS